MSSTAGQAVMQNRGYVEETEADKKRHPLDPMQSTCRQIVYRYVECKSSVYTTFPKPPPAP